MRMMERRRKERTRTMGSLRLWLFVLLAFIYTSDPAVAQNTPGPNTQTGVDTGNGTAKPTGPQPCHEPQVCKPGVLIPAWEPVHNVTTLQTAGRATVYILAMAYLFLGVSIIADRFMAAIEVITSQERQVRIHRPNGETITVNVRTWNETVSNLTLMALGSSAPEIMLSIIEVIGQGFKSGDLGPGTIVGSAAFNLFVIIGLCVAVIPDGEVRRIKHLRVFIITASWSLFAYLWLYIIIAHISPNVVTVWEAGVTFLFFPATVITAYIADKKIFFGRFLTKKYRATLGTNVAVEGRESLELDDKEPVLTEDAELKEFEKTRQDYIEILREMRKKHPDADMRQLEDMAATEVLNRGPKSRAFYRIQATRKLTGGGNIIKKKVERRDSISDIKVVSHDDDVTRIFFDPGHYTVMENVGEVKVMLTRQGGDLNNTVYVDYRSEDGTANAGSDYDLVEGTIVFYPGETQKEFSVTIIDDDVFEEDEHFFIGLSNVRADSLQGDVSTANIQLVSPSTATVMILDDDHAGIFHFEQSEMNVPESIGENPVKVMRSSGARGSVRIPYKTIDGTAKGRGKDYLDEVGELLFGNDETEAILRVGIINHQEYERNQTFIVELGQPYSVDPSTGETIALPDEKDEEDLSPEERIAILGQPRLGEHFQVLCHIRESVEFKGTVDKLLKKANMSLVIGTSSWREQFHDAIHVNAGDDDEEEEGGEKEARKPSCSDYVMHCLSFFWKFLFAFVPPTDYLGGWAAFTVSILIIGFLTAIIGDVASSFGCTVGLQDAVTALSFVALGTSIPDTFASKVAALQDDYADSSIGNVTGSNAVNVFLGIGIAWSIAAIYHAYWNTVFEVKAGSLGFSVTMFCCCSIVCIGIILLRRLKPVQGELGGPKVIKYATAVILFMLWIFYVLMSSLESYCHIKGF